ncbi:unnamed protein product [Protopolystoma xenopodis]|uniref:Uncharacterized protein n=1 Tax=Protopolystoma xenopodis TaxID=117903 RepID=A0A448XQD0_9PLAT|nr:unnamed protein product [Protopolystoma xenopodis]
MIISSVRPRTWYILRHLAGFGGEPLVTFGFVLKTARLAHDAENAAGEASIVMPGQGKGSQLSAPDDLATAQRRSQSQFAITRCCGDHHVHRSSVKTLVWSAKSAYMNAWMAGNINDYMKRWRALNID